MVTDGIVQVDGLKVHYWEAGDPQGKALLLVHGGIGDAALHWDAVMPMLGENFRVLAPDLPGYGGSDSLPVMRTDVVLHWLKAFLDVMRVEQAVIVGNAFGGLIARLFAASSPQYVPAVILVNGGGVPDLPALLKLVQRIPALRTLVFSQFGKMATGKGMLKRMIHLETVLTDSFFQQAQLAAPAFAAMMQMLVSSGIPSTQTPLVPTLILWGVNDTFTPLHEGAAVKASIPGATLVEVSDCGHMPQLEAPDVFTWQVNTFLEKLARPPSSSRSGPKMLRNTSG